MVPRASWRERWGCALACLGTSAVQRSSPGNALPVKVKSPLRIRPLIDWLEKGSWPSQFQAGPTEDAACSSAARIDESATARVP